MNVNATDDISKPNTLADCEYQLKPNPMSLNSSSEVTPPPAIVSACGNSSSASLPTGPDQIQNKVTSLEVENKAASSEVINSKISPSYSTTFDYLYEFSETRKVLEDFFKCPTNDEEKKIVDCFNESDTGSFVSTNHRKKKSRFYLFWKLTFDRVQVVLSKS